MTADPTTLLRAAAEKARRLAEGADYCTITDARIEGVWLNNAHYVTIPPGVALAVAAWLDMQAECVANYGPNADSPWVQPHTQMALAVARELLGETGAGS